MMLTMAERGSMLVVILRRGRMFTKESNPNMSNAMSMIGTTFHMFTAERRDWVLHLRQLREFPLTVTGGYCKRKRMTLESIFNSCNV